MAQARNTQLATRGAPAPTTEIVRQEIPAAALAEMDREVDDLSDQSPLFPLTGFVFEGTLLSGKFAEFYDSEGFKIEFRCTSSNIPELQPGKTYTQIFFSKHPTMPKILLSKHGQFRRAFFAAVQGVQEDDPSFKPSGVAKELHAAVDDIGLKMRVRSTVAGYTRNGKAKIDISYEVLP